MPPMDTEQQLAARLAILENPDAQDCTVYRADDQDQEAEEVDLGDAKVLFCGPFEAPADWDAAEREDYFGESAPELFVNARIECEAKPGSNSHFTVDIGDYVAAQPGLGEVVMFYVHDYLEDDTGCTYVLLRDEEVLE
ncbi:conserved hypothetical protein [Pseudomonas sp. 9AZ]|uniref:hypothetical protein n=1 Tax=Pseudomonas sp. 9AZ TaxID=2653168 RepID=UPI0012F4245A|nr:hypothetical protein [Pseudomonas sp. 9AZ]VXC99707.1 conserved hypothetical protein [Pseudomonas sp. 9AZ]